jgi:hypothetical protein
MNLKRNNIMSDQELERIAELIFQKLLIRQKEFEEEEEGELPPGWVPEDSSKIWYSFSGLGSISGKELLMQRLVALNIEKQELIEQENYEDLINLQEAIDEIKEYLKKYKD